MGIKERAFNFSAGPSMLPLKVLEDAASQMTSFNGLGESVMEMSHRSKEYKEIMDAAEANLRDLMKIPSNYKILFLQGGGTLQFSMVPLNLLRNSKKADYIITGSWAKKAYTEAKKFGDIIVAASSEDDNFTYIPKTKKEDFRADADYVHITYNNTISGSHFNSVPDVGELTLVADMSSCILSEEIDVSNFGLIYAGAQKNVAPAGMTMVIIREDLLGFADEKTPVYLDYKSHADTASMYNTPPCYTIYIAGEVFKYIKEIGGVKGMHQRDLDKANKLYDAIEGSSMFTCPVKKEDRSLMNVVFVTGDKELDSKFVAEAKEIGLINLKGHRSVGGLRASIYNAMPAEGVDALVEFMKKFESENK
ncbi:MAG: 3-phosphoserine/phosphohydroxythreonine transaminase [Clostridiales bacterium]|nr:3-phosphoserine/phosphohydroxythreonine transaminase [Clostridiales bacterium]